MFASQVRQRQLLIRRRVLGLVPHGHCPRGRRGRGTGVPAWWPSLTIREQLALPHLNKSRSSKPSLPVLCLRARTVGTGLSPGCAYHPRRPGAVVPKCNTNAIHRCLPKRPGWVVFLFFCSLLLSYGVRSTSYVHPVRGPPCSGQESSGPYNLRCRI